MTAKVLTAAVLLVVGSLGTQVASGQGERPNGTQPEVPKEKIQASGTLKGVRNGTLYVLTDDGGQWVVNIERDAKRVMYVGSADATWLRPGMFVEFSATVNNKGETTVPVKSATVMTPTKDVPPGVASDIGGGSGLFEVKDEREKPKEETTKVRVVGQIQGMKDNVASVNGGNAALKVTFDPDAKISIELPGAAGMQLVRPGDKIEFSGWYILNNKGQAWAGELSVSGSEPFTSKKPTTTRPMPKQDP